MTNNCLCLRCQCDTDDVAYQCRVTEYPFCWDACTFFVRLINFIESPIVGFTMDEHARLHIQVKAGLKMSFFGKLGPP